MSPSFGAARPHITDSMRRARLMRRHRLTAGNRAESVTDAVASMVALHATTPSTVYLSAWARIDGFDSAAMDFALYDERSVVRHLAMRRTLFVFTRDTLADAVSAVGPRVRASERTNMLRDLRRSEAFDDPDGWIDTARAAVLDELARGEALTSTQLRERCRELDGQVAMGAGKSWGGASPMGPRILNMMSAAGDIVRGPNLVGWHLSRPEWVLMEQWLGAPLPAIGSEEERVEAGHRGLIRRWLRAFGPGTETDLVWWLGSTKRAVRAALAELDVVTVGLDGGGIGYVLADDVPSELEDHGVQGDGAERGVAALLPELDPTTMGHKERHFYLGEHVDKIFDSTGNGGATAWWDGRIVGGWYRRDDGSVAVHPFEKLPARATRALNQRADELTSWIGSVPLKVGYTSHYMRSVRQS